MLDIETDMLALEKMCSTAVDMLLQRHSWHLLDKEEFGCRTVAFVRENPHLDTRHAAVHVYTLVMYHACMGNEGRPRQEVAYAELYRYLSDQAQQRFPDVAEEATQRAVVRIYETLQACRKPGAFLAFAFQRLRDAVRTVRRQERQCDQSLERVVGNDVIPLRDLLPDTRHPDLDDQIITEALRTQLWHVSVEFRARHPRAGKQFDTLWLKYIEELDDTAISRRLGTSVANVYVLRCRAVRKLQADPLWRQLAVVAGMLPDCADNEQVSTADTGA